MRTPLFFLSSLLGVCLLGEASAQTSPATTGKPALLTTAPAEAVTAKARDLYAEGVKAFREQRWPEAYAAFMGAWALNKHYTIAGNLGVAELELGKTRDAAEHLAIYLRGLAQDAKSTKEEREKGARAFEQARAKVLALKVSANVEGADIRVDDRPVGTAPVVDPLFVEPGKHRLEVRAGDHFTERRDVEGKAGETHEITVTLTKIADVPYGGIPPVAVTSTPPAPPAAPRSLVPVYVMGAAAVAGAALGGGLLGASRAEYDKTKQLSEQVREAGGTCMPGAPNVDARCAQVASTGESSNALRTGGVIGLAVAGAAAAGAVVYWLWPAPKPAQSSVKVLPAVAGDGGAFVVFGRF